MSTSKRCKTASGSNWAFVWRRAVSKHADKLWNWTWFEGLSSSGLKQGASASIKFVSQCWKDRYESCTFLKPNLRFTFCRCVYAFFVFYLPKRLAQSITHHTHTAYCKISIKCRAKSPWLRSKYFFNAAKWVANKNRSFSNDTNRTLVSEYARSTNFCRRWRCSFSKSMLPKKGKCNRHVKNKTALWTALGFKQKAFSVRSEWVS